MTVMSMKGVQRKQLKQFSSKKTTSLKVGNNLGKKKTRNVWDEAKMIGHIPGPTARTVFDPAETCVEQNFEDQILALNKQAKTNI